MGRFLIAGPPARLRAILELLAEDPTVLIRAVAPTAGTDPERLVVSMDPHRAEALRTALGGLVTIEPDDQLVPFDPI
jgi:hypothetical protein